MKINFDAALESVLHHEGGFVNHPKDPGGITNLGVTKRVWENWIGREVNEAEMRALTPKLIGPMYKQMYWDKIRGDDPLVRRFVYIFIAFWSVLSSLYIGFITFVQIPESNIRFADTILGFTLGTMVAGMFQFLLGSSLGSRSKDKK